MVKLSHILLLLFCSPGFLLAQVSLRNADTSPADVASQLAALREIVLQTQKAMALQAEEIEKLKRQLKVQTLLPTGAPALLPSTQPSTDGVASVPVVEPVEPSGDKTQADNKNSFSSIKLGDAELTPGGFVDLENVFRTTNTQNNIATNYATIPFSNSPPSRLTEFRTTAQFSRINLKVTDKFAGNEVLGYIEGDLSGNDSSTVYQTVNGHTNRLRLYFGDLKRGKWEFLGGQTWSWLTPNREGLGATPSDLAISYNEDQNLGVGVAYTRAAEFRVAYHWNDHWAFGAGVENPDQFTGSFVALPAAYSTVLSSQFDNGSQAGAPSLFPDIISKVSYDSQLKGKHFHLEAAGFMNSARESVMPKGETIYSSHSALGGGVQLATNYQLTTNLRFLANVFISNGGGRYLVADGPQVVLRPNSSGTNVTPSMVHADAGTAGFEWQASQKAAFSLVYGVDYFGRNAFADTTNAANPSSIIGYGGPGSPNSNNRAIQEITFDWLHTFWKHPKYGAMQFYTQYSYLTRAPWYVAAGNPKDAHLSMIYLGFRYVLPSTAGTLLRVPYPN